MYEIFTQGGGVYIVDILNGVSAMVGGDSYIRTMEISALVALFIVMIRVAFGGDFKQTAIWIASFTVLYNVLMLPKVTVNVVDRLNPTLPASTVANVPYGLAFTASLISEIGLKLTETAEQLYSLPDDMQYQKTGMIFGSQLLAKTTQIKIVDSVFADNMNNFAQQCIFYDLLLNRYSIDELKVAPDIWEFLTVTNFQSSLRGIYYNNGTTTTYKTCAETATLLDAQWSTQITKAQNIYAPQLYPGETPTAAKALLVSQLPVSHEYLLGASRDASSQLKQNMMINAIHYSLTDYAATTASPTALSVYADARSDAQTEASYRLIARKAGLQISRLKVIFESIYYGSFPFIFLLMLLPEGFAFFRTYVMGLAWIQLWGPMNAILHRLMMGEAREATLGAGIMPDGTSALTLVSQSGIESVNNDIAVTAGFFISTIPFLSLILTKTGFSAFGSLATSYLNISHGAATQAANEATTGNISLGNTSFNNHSANNVSANKYDTSGYMDANTMRTQYDSGLKTTHFGSGHTTFDRSPMISNLGEHKMNVSDNVSQRLDHAADRYHSMSQTAANNASYEMSAALNTAGQMMHTIGQQQASGVDYSSRLSSEQSQAVENMTSHVKRFAQSEGLSENVGGKVLTSVAASKSFMMFKGSLEASGYGEYASRENYEKAKDYAEQHNLRDSLSIGTSIAENKTFNLSDSEGNSYSDTINNHLNQARSFSQQESEYATKGQSFSSKASEVKENGLSTNKDMSNEFVQWLPNQLHLDGSGREIGESGAHQILSGNSVNSQRYLEHYLSSFSHYKEQSMFKEIENNLSGNTASNNNFREQQEQVVRDFHQKNGNLHLAPSHNANDNSMMQYNVPMQIEEGRYGVKASDQSGGRKIVDEVEDEQNSSAFHQFNTLTFKEEDK